MQETANKQKRITLKTLHEMLNGMSVELAEKVHLLFMANYIDYSDYKFRDENQVEGYCWCYRDLFELKTMNGGRMLPLAIGRQRMISAIGLPTSGIASSRPCRRR